MARELIIKIRCDFCGNQVTEEEAHSGEVILDGVIYHLDLCGEHSDDLVAKLTPKPKNQALAIQEAPRISSFTPKSQRQTPCPVCGVKCKNDRGVRLHIFKMHPDALDK